MFLIGEIGGRRQPARVSSPHMNAAGRRTMYVHIPGLKRTRSVGNPRLSGGLLQRRQPEVSQEPASWGCGGAGVRGGQSETLDLMSAWVRTAAANSGAPRSQAGAGSLRTLRVDQLDWCVALAKRSVAPPPGPPPYQI